MSKGNKSTLRIDWFDGTLVEDNSRSNDAATSSSFGDEEPPEATPPPANPQYSEKKPIGFKRLLDISLLQPPLLTLEVAHRPGFWNLLDTELKGDFIVLIVKVLAQIYKTLEPREKSRIATQLKNKFEKSMFLNTLRNYLINLPQVRIVEKRMNSQLWDDVKSFYNYVFSLFDGIVYYGDNSPEFLMQIHDLLEVTKSSAIGVKEEHTETISNDLLVKIHLLQSKILNLTNEDLNKEVQLEETDDEPTSYKNLSVFPSKDDLLGKTEVELKSNIVNGAYSSVKHYLDLQFKLLREDCFGPLRDGICKYMANPTRRRYENIRVYPSVRISRTYVSNNKVGHLVDIAWKERVNNGNVNRRNYANNKQLMFGSLLIFSGNNFETILCATVLESNMQDLYHGYVAVSFQNPVSQNIFTETYVMVESEVFFEPYHRVLKVLQNFKQDDIPMKRYIVDVQTETKPPVYLSSDTTYSIIDSEAQELSFPVLDLDQWPENKSFGLDYSQMEAYKLALTREFSVIQGPPGTGKTFIGAKIASTLLKNLSLEGTPMLIICYTNHALDQFLESILGITKSIVRLGSQSKNEKLEPYTLYNLRGKVKSRYSYLYSSKKSELERIYNQMTDLQTKIEVCEKQILSYECIQPYLKIGNKTYELKSSKEDPLLIWLFNDFTETEVVPQFDEWVGNVVSDFPKVSEPTDEFQIEACFSDETACKELQVLQKSVQHVRTVADCDVLFRKMVEKFEAQIDRVEKRLACFRKRMPLEKYDYTKEENFENVSDLYSLSLDRRWSFYYSIARKVENVLFTGMNDLLKQHDKCNEELNAMSTLLDSEVIKTVRVVGATTTTAARRHDLLKKLLSPIVIVEEAAEVLEAHIVASLTDHCQHLILIGDHKQLRPTAAHYKLAKDYNLEVSLFERMIRNGIHAHVLTTQRRMRPQFVELLVPTIYEKLDTHPSVNQYLDVMGMAHNLYFYTHEALEDNEDTDDSWSHTNTLEAKWCVALANYLHQIKYKVGDITILGTYNGQVTLIKRLIKKDYTSLLDIKVTAVDNYQGEENRIVILSLVRSNRDGKIGFLAAPNRICVALSRAKEGFYIFGNMNILKSASNIWRSIEDKLIAQNAIGTKIKLQCAIHGRKTLEISDPKDFATSTLNLCSRTCKIK